MGAGMGGGSSDATYVLLAINEIFELKLSNEKLESYAAQLGSDCAFFVKGGAQLSTGRGEVLSPIELDLSGKYLKIINPEIHISTAEAYSNVKMVDGNSITKVLANPLELWRDQLQNSFETHAFRMHPVLNDIKSGMFNEGAVYASMSGSGATLFGIYNEKPKLNSGYNLEWVFEL